jgi:hypothetical protein
MSSEQPEHFVAEHGHEQPAVAGLSGILDRYDRHRAAIEQENPDQAITLEEREQFALDYSAFREHGLRAALEEVGWQLEQRGHHAWIEDIGAESVPAAVDTAREQKAVPRPLAFRALPAHTDLDRSQAPQLRFVPDTDECRVRVEVLHGPSGIVEPVPVSVPLRVQGLNERLLIEMATDFVREVLLGGEHVELESDTDPEHEIIDAARRDRSFDGSLVPGSTPERESEVPHDWSDTGITRRWLAQQEQTRKAT